MLLQSVLQGPQSWGRRECPPYFSSQMKNPMLLLGRRLNKSSNVIKTKNEYDAQISKNTLDGLHIQWSILAWS